MASVTISGSSTWSGAERTVTLTVSSDPGSTTASWTVSSTSSTAGNHPYTKIRATVGSTNVVNTSYPSSYPSSDAGDGWATRGGTKTGTCTVDAYGNIPVSIGCGVGHNNNTDISKSGTLVKPQTFTVSYNANGGTSTPSSQSCTSGSSITLAGAISRNNATSTSNETITISYNANGGSSTPGNTTGTAVNTTTTKYTFEKWHLNSTTGTGYNAGASYAATANCTFYAGWTSSTSTARTTNPSIKLANAISRSNGSTTGYTVTYNANGGSSTPSSQTSTRTITYSFNGWNTNNSGTGTNYSAATNYTFSANATLYANWGSSYTNNSITLPAAISRNNDTLNSHVVSYNANGGSSTPSSQTSTITRKWTFGGWNTNNSGTGTNYNASSSYTPSANTTLYAKWSSSDTQNSITLPSAISRANGAAAGYNVTYNANGGSNAPSSTTSGNRTITYTFSKWAAGSASGTTYSAGASYTPSAATTMYATWTSSTSANSSWTCSSQVPTRTGYTFLGWSTNSSATTATYTAGSTYTITGALTLYAVWKVNYYYLDLAGYLDGKNSDTIYDFGTCDVYINGSKVATGVTDYYVQHPYGTSYEFKNIVPDWGCGYKGVQSGALSGTLGVGGATTRLSFIRYPVVINANQNGSWEKGIVWVNVNGEWKKARALNINNENEWKRLEKYDFTL